MKKIAEPEMEVVELSRVMLTDISATADNQPCGNYCSTPEEITARGYECWGLEY